MVLRIRALLCASFIAAFAACVAGCAGAPPQPDAELSRAAAMPPQAAQALVAIGKSTKADVEAALGQAVAVQFDSGWEVWVYRWRGKVASAKEILMVIKIRARDYARVEARVRQLHPYDLPEVISLSIASGYSRYLAWLEDPNNVQ